PDPPPLPVKPPAPRPGWRDPERKHEPTRLFRPGWQLYAAAGGALFVMLLLFGHAIVEDFSHGWIKVNLGEPTAPVDVVFDGKPVAKGFLNEPIRLTTGEHHLWVAGSAYQPWSRTFSVGHGVNPG